MVIVIDRQAAPISLQRTVEKLILTITIAELVIWGVNNISIVPIITERIALNLSF